VSFSLAAGQSPGSVAATYAKSALDVGFEQSRYNDGLRFVSLGAYCGVRKSLQKIGRDAEALPFDWMRTRTEGILRYLRDDFAGFFEYDTRLPVPGAVPLTMYRDYYHSFWHDSPEDPKDQDKYRRRMERFKKLGQLKKGGQGLIFVRSTAHSAEATKTDELLQELITTFGPGIRLLQIVDFQRSHRGPARVLDRPNLLVYFLASEHHLEPRGAPYADPLNAAVEWATGRLTKAMDIDSIKMLPHYVDFADGWLVDGLEPYEEYAPKGAAGGGKWQSQPKQQADAGQHVVKHRALRNASVSTLGSSGGSSDDSSDETPDMSAAPPPRERRVRRCCQ